ncbi:hypothetical protein [Mesorhizobium sp. A623]
MKFHKHNLPNGRLTLMVFDIEDIASTGAGAVCTYNGDELADAKDHADNRGGIIVSADWTGFITVEHVAPKARAADIREQLDSRRINEESEKIGMTALAFMRARDERLARNALSHADL